MPSLVPTRCVLAFLLATPPLMGAEGGVREVYEKAAESLEFFACHDFLYEREPAATVPGDKAEAYNRTLYELFGGPLGVFLPGEANNRYTLDRMLVNPRPAQALVILLEHENPKVRTLALAGLFRLEDPKLLPRIAALAKDEAATFPEPFRYASMAFSQGQPAMPPMEPRTVGQIARAMVRFYMERSGYFYGIDGNSSHPGFEQYWQARKDRAHGLGWFEVRLDRATQGRFPIRPDRLFQIYEIRQQVDKLPPLEREMTLLALFAGRDVHEAVTEQDLVFAARRLGPDRLMRVLADDPLVNDPDLPFRIEGVQNFTLHHAGQLLRASGATTLLETGRRTRKSKWFIAAAELLPPDAGKILHEAFDRCNFLNEERMQTALALWRLSGPSESSFLIGWFYRDDEPKLGRAPYRAEFADFLLDRFEAGDRALLNRMIADERFADLDWSALRAIVEGLNRNLLRPVVEPGEIEKAWHPLGESHFHGMIEKAGAEYPKETAGLLAILAGWRSRVRQSVAEWAAP